ncbi:MAG: PilZ domain-containing protein [Spirochaetota bacterium]
MASGINRIEKEFVLKEMMEKRFPLEVHIQRERLQAFIEELGEDTLTIRLGNDLFPEDIQTLVCFFRFRNNPMTFRASVVEVRDSLATVSLPSALYRDLSRGFERIQPPLGLSLSFVHKGTTVELDYPDTDQYEPVDDPGVQPGFDVSQIAELMAAFRERASEFAAESKIIMFRERTPSSFQEQLVAQTGKILVVPLTGNESRLEPLEVRERVLSQDQVVAHEEERGNDMFSVLEQLGTIANENRAKGIAHELYCPVLYHQYVVGYMYLVRTGARDESFPPQTYEFALYYARILAYALKKNGYFQAGRGEREYGAHSLIDISGSGALFVVPEGTPAIHLFTDLPLMLSMSGRSIPIKGRVMRKFADTQGTYLAVQFIELDPDDLEFLIEQIYGAGYSGDVDSSGAADPRNLPPGEV